MRMLNIGQREVLAPNMWCTMYTVDITKNPRPHQIFENQHFIKRKLRYSNHFVKVKVATFTITHIQSVQNTFSNMNIY